MSNGSLTKGFSDAAITNDIERSLTLTLSLIDCQRDYENRRVREYRPIGALAAWINDHLGPLAPLPYAAVASVSLMNPVVGVAIFATALAAETIGRLTGAALNMADERKLGKRLAAAQQELAAFESSRAKVDTGAHSQRLLEALQPISEFQSDVIANAGRAGEKLREAAARLLAAKHSPQSAPLPPRGYLIMMMIGPHAQLFKNNPELLEPALKFALRTGGDGRGSCPPGYAIAARVPVVDRCP